MSSLGILKVSESYYGDIKAIFLTVDVFTTHLFYINVSFVTFTHYLFL